MGGTWPNSCVPSFPEVEITDADGDGDGEILIETFGTLVVPTPPKEAECAPEETEWRLEIHIGRLRPGKYCVTVTYRIHPLAEPEEIARIRFYVVPVLITVCPSGCEYSKIQEAIDAARPGDKIEVQAIGSPYRETLTIQTPDLWLQAADGRVVIDGGGAEVVVSIMADGVQFEGFEVQSGWVGIAVEDASDVSLRDNVVTPPGVGHAGIRLENSSNNVLQGNRVGGFVGSIVLFGSHENLIEGNETTAGHMGRPQRAISSPAQSRRQGR
jgi:parallel beta-helix repeat protein